MYFTGRILGSDDATEPQSIGRVLDERFLGVSALRDRWLLSLPVSTGYDLPA